MTENRKQIYQAINVKLAAIESKRKGESVAEISKRLKVGRSTVYDWIKEEEKLISYSNKVEDKKQLEIKKTTKGRNYEVLEDILFVWFQQERRKGTILTGPILKAKAENINETISRGSKFSASNGWFDRWKERFGIRFINVCGEKFSADASSAEVFVETFRKIIQEGGYLPEQVYNFDETGVCPKMIPNKTFASSEEKSTSNFKINKERITVGLGANVTGNHRLPPFVIGKYAKPRALKNISAASLPVLYRAQKSAWMSSSLFEEWFINEFVPKAKEHLRKMKLPEKGILVIDNAPTHNIDLEYENFKIIFLPPNVTSLIQPMDQGVIAALKKRYKKKLLTEIIEIIDNKENYNMMMALKMIDLRQIIFMISESYAEIEKSTFRKSWNKLWPESERSPNIQNQENNHAEDRITIDNINQIIKIFNDVDGFENIDHDFVEGWINNTEVMECEFLTDDEIVESIFENKSVDNITEEKTNHSEEIKEIYDLGTSDNINRISHKDAFNAFDIVIKYVETQQSDITFDYYMMKKWRQHAKNNHTKSLRQTKISEFFNKN